MDGWIGLDDNAFTVVHHDLLTVVVCLFVLVSFNSCLLNINMYAKVLHRRYSVYFCESATGSMGECGFWHLSS